MDFETRIKKNTDTVRNAFELAYRCANHSVSTIIVYTFKDMALDLCDAIHGDKKKKMLRVNLHSFRSSDDLRAYLFGGFSGDDCVLTKMKGGTIVFLNADLITRDFQKMLKAFYDAVERDNLGIRMIFLSRTDFRKELASGEYDESLYYRIHQTLIDCRLEGFEDSYH